MSHEEYRRIVPTFWTDPDVKRRLSRDEKLLLLYFCSSPHSTMIGVYYCPFAYAANETDMSVEAVRDAVTGPLSPFLTYDEGTEEVFVHGLAKHNLGPELKVGKDKEGRDKPDHRIEGVRRLLESVHSRQLVRAFLERYSEPYKLSAMGLPDLADTPSKGVPRPPKGLPSPLSSPSEAKAVHNKAVHNKTLRPAKAAANGAAAGNWVADYTVLFEQIGVFEPGRVGRACQKVRAKYGPERTREMLEAFVAYAPHLDRQGEVDPRIDNSQFTTPEQFAATAARWYARTEPIDLLSERSPPERGPPAGSHDPPGHAAASAPAGPAVPTGVSPDARRSRDATAPPR